jgi:DNA-binding Lrp family transcriptional regulator
MRTDAPALMPIFRSQLQARLLLEVLTSAEPLTASQLARMLDAPDATVSREVRRLVEAGLVRGERVGRALRLHPAVDNPATAPLRQLLVVTFGPAMVLEKALAGIDGVQHAYVHGSWAARYQGEPGGPPGDIDLVLIGRPSRRVVDTALQDLEEELGREVNATYVSPERWQDDDDPFIRTVRSRPLVALRLTPELEEDA